MAKREVHPLLKQLLALDVTATNAFCSFCEPFMPIRALKVHYKVLELSCHGIPWLAGWLVFIWTANSASLFQMQVNVYIGLILDIIIVGVIKAIVRRRRPALNVPDMPVTVGPDVYSFPSGHTTRAVFLAYFFIFLWPVPFLMRGPLLAWATAVSVSRVLMRRHHILDIAAGVIVGIFEALLVSLIWCNQSTSSSLLSWLTDDNFGAEYHV